MATSQRHNSARRIGQLAAIILAVMAPALARQDPRPGVIVEKVTKNSPADKAGLREADTISSWSQKQDQGAIESPLDLSAIELEWASRGNVTLSGLRGPEAFTWTLNPTDNWGLETRPQLSGKLLELYEQGRKAADEGKAAEAAEQWQAAIAEAQGSSQAGLTVWLMSRSAKLFAARQQWDQADLAHRAAIEQAGRVRAEIEAVLLRRWAETFLLRGDTSRAVQLYRQALLKNRQSMAAAANLSSLGYLAYLLGNLDEAEDDYRQALALRETFAPDSLAVGWSLSSLSPVTSLRGAPTQAQEMLQRALAIKQRLAPGSIDVARTLEKLGFLARERGDLVKADEDYQEALTIYDKLQPESSDLALLLNSSGGVPWDQDDLPRAEELFRKALAMMEKVNPQNNQIPAFLNNLGAVALNQERPGEAEAYFQRALALLPPGSPSAALTLSNLGDVASRKGDLAGAEQYYSQSLGIDQKLAPFGLPTAAILYRLGETARLRKDLVAAESCHRRALTIRQDLAPGTLSHAESLAALGSVMQAAGRLEESSLFFDQALHALENQVSRLGANDEIRSTFRASHSDFYRDYIDVLIRQNKPDLAFQVLERSRARTLLDLLAEAHVDIRKGVDPGLLEQERSLEADFKAKSGRRIQLLSGTHRSDQVALVEQEIEKIATQLKDLRQQIRSRSPGYAALTQPQVLTLKDVQQQLLDQDTLLLAYSLGRERSYVFAVAVDSFAVYPLPQRTKIEAATEKAYREELSVNNPAGGQALTRSLGRMLIQPLSKHLNKKRLAIVADGALHYIPFAALRTSSSARLGTAHEIVNLPSASSLAVLRKETNGRAPAAKWLAVLADPVFAADDDRVKLASLDASQKATIGSAQQKAAESSAEQLTRSAADVGLANQGALHLQRLPSTRREAKSIVAAAPKRDNLVALDFDASRSTAVSPNLAQYRIVHFATHGLIDSRHPALSGIVLSLVNQRGEPQNGFLGLEDIYNLNLSADLVVLSACETGLGKQIQGEGLVGLARGFMYGGTPRLVSSLWRVPDRATAELMKQFYIGMLQEKLPPAAALRQAQIKLAGNPLWSAPYFWAGFTLQGEWK